MISTFSRLRINCFRVANAGRGQLNMICFPLSPFAPENLVSWDKVRPSHPAPSREFSTHRNMVLTDEFLSLDLPFAAVSIHAAKCHRVNAEFIMSLKY